MVKQYDAIEAVPGVHLNGKLTLGENLADLGGLWLAWLAWLDKAAGRARGHDGEDRRLHAGSALLDRLCAAVVHADAARATADPGAVRPARARRVPDQYGFSRSPCAS
jgi:predicted metalloendopeptidase